jgi:hypothetical protein
MTLRHGPQACEFCNGTPDVRVCTGERPNGELCPSRLCWLPSYMGARGFVCPECNASFPATTDHLTRAPFGRARMVDLLMAYEHAVGMLTDEEDKLTIDFVRPPSQQPARQSLDHYVKAITYRSLL